MSGLAVSAIRSRLAAAVTLPGWRHANTVVDLFGRDARELVHLGFAVGVGSTTPAPLDRQSARGGVDRSTIATTTVLVRWAHQLRSDGQVLDYDAALDAEQELVAALLAVDANPDLHVRLARIPSRTAVGDGTFLVGSLELEVLHRLALA